MSAGRCPVCGGPKERRVHLVCPYCWVKVPEADQREVYRLFEAARGPGRTPQKSEAHREKCFQVIRTLLLAYRKAKADGRAWTQAVVDKIRGVSPHDLPLAQPKAE